MNIIGEKTSFADRLVRMMERVEYRRADNDEDKAAIFKMRHEAYTRDGRVAPSPSGMFHDEMDETPNAWLIGVFIDGELASSVRLHISASVDAPLPAAKVFSDVLVPRLNAGQCLVDVTRHTNRLEFTRQYPEMPYITVRPAFLAEAYFEADYLVAAVRTEHVGAFRRMYGFVGWTAPREYPLLGRQMPLIAYDCQALRAKTHARYPFYKSNLAELRQLFRVSSNGVEPSPVMFGAERAAGAA